MWQQLKLEPDQSIEQALTEAFSGTRQQVLACHVKHETAYLAIQKNGRTSAWVIVLDHRDDSTIDYTATPEREGPDFFDCPDDLLDLLDSDPPSSLAKLWRYECRLRNSERRRRTERFANATLR